MDEDDEDTIGWEDGGGWKGEEDEDIIWENGEESDGATALESREATAGDDDLDEESAGGPEERRWLGRDGEIILELPREDDGIDETGAGDALAADGAGAKPKVKAKPHRFTAEEIRQALGVHTAHLACLVSRCALVNSWAGDPAVQAAMLSCLPPGLFPEDAAEPRGAAGRQSRLPLASLVVWFRDFLDIVEDGAVGAGGGGTWGSRPRRLLRVIDQRAGCPQEAVQLFVGLCRGLGLHARYVACLDPLPPHPRPPGPSKQTRANTVDLVAEELREQREQRQREKQRGRSSWWGSGRSTQPMGSRSWAEVLCQDGRELYVVTPMTDVAASVPVRPGKAASSSPSVKRPRPASSPLSHAQKRRIGTAECIEEASVGGSGSVGPIRGGDEVGAGDRSAEDADDSNGRRPKRARRAIADASTSVAGSGGGVSEPGGESSGEKGGAESKGKGKGKGKAKGKGNRTRASEGDAGAEDETIARQRGSQKDGRAGIGSPTGPAGSGGSGDGSGTRGSRVSGGGGGESRERDVEKRWIHVDPVLGAVNQADKVQATRFRKQLMPYVVAQDGEGRIVDVTRRYSSEWSKTLRTRGHAMAGPEGWWARALRAWNSVPGARHERGSTRRKEGPRGVDGPEARLATIEHESREERELQEKVDNEPIPSTLAALKNHHVYILAKGVNKFDGLRPGAKAAGLVKGCKVYLRSDVARLKGASRWKQDGLKVKDSELDKPAKVVTKKGEKDGEGSGKLYGEWQTERWVPQAAVDGKVPKNEYGNVEFFDCNPAFLPPGTVHVRGDQIGRVAAKLGLDYAPALTGFEAKQGRQVPVTEGIIVCKEHGQTLRDAHTMWEQAMLEKRAKAREQRVLRRWRQLFQAVMLGANLQEQYGSHD